MSTLIATESQWASETECTKTFLHSSLLNKLAAMGFQLSLHLLVFHLQWFA